MIIVWKQIVEEDKLPFSLMHLTPNNDFSKGDV